MLELTISKPSQPAMIPEGATKRQALPKGSEFAQMMQSSLPQSKAALLDGSVNKKSLTEIEVDLKGSALNESIDIDSMELNVVELESLLEESSKGGLITTDMALEESVLSSTLNQADKSNAELSANESELILNQQPTTLNADLLPINSINDELSEVVETQPLTADVVGLPSSEVSSEAEALAESEVLSAMTPDEELVLGQAIISADEISEKGLMTPGTEKGVDRTTELSQEARAIKLASANDQAAQNPMMQKNASSEDAGQQSRGQSAQQQFSNMAQVVSQTTQSAREQQVERQFSSVLNERMVTQTQTASESTRGSSLLTSSDSRAQLPVGLQSIGLPVTHQKWGQALGQRVVYMANQQMQQAQITLNPEKLGPVQVRLQIDRDQKVSVVMTAQHGITREAMEAAMPRLREMLEQSGIDVSSVDVNDQKQFAEGEQDSSENKQASSVNGETVDENNADGTASVITHSTDNVVDYYA